MTQTSVSYSIFMLHSALDLVKCTMPRFRAAPNLPAAFADYGVNPASVRALIAEVFQLGHFYLDGGLSLVFEHLLSEDISWEIFRGHLLDPVQTRARKSFESWNAYLVEGDRRSQEPLVSLKFDIQEGQLHVVRALECYVWQAIDAGGNVIETQERRKWVRELVGSIDLSSFESIDDLADELICQLFLAVVGTSRLPLTSVEAPLPLFSFGQLFYCYLANRSGAAEPVRDWRSYVELNLQSVLSEREVSRVLEFLLRTIPRDCLDQVELTGSNPFAVLRRVYNGVSLTPYTDLVPQTISLFGYVLNKNPRSLRDVIDFLSWLLRHVCRHLTAYDLVTFHHRGANYPDALLLEAVLQEYLKLADRHLELFTGNDKSARRRRRALRQAWIIRRSYEGHLVPDSPTSSGENTRVLPASHPRIAEEQILQPTCRSRTLFADNELSVTCAIEQLLSQSIQDLEDKEELKEMGAALFLDRPLGTAKVLLERDQTPLFATLAFSPGIAKQRLKRLAEEPWAASHLQEIERCQGRLAAGAVCGLSLDLVGGMSQPGKVSLRDAQAAANDFVLLQTTSGSVSVLLEAFDFTPLMGHLNLEFFQRPLLIVPAAREPGIIVYDDQFRPRLLFELNVESGYIHRAGYEYPAGGLRVRRIWIEGEQRDVSITVLLGKGNPPCTPEQVNAHRKGQLGPR